MWDQKLFELFTTFIPQGFAFILLFFSLMAIKIEKKSYLLFSIGLSIIMFLLKPYVNFGIHSILMMFILVLIAVIWGKANVIPAVVYALITFASAYLCEWVTFIFLGMIKFNMELLKSDPQIRVIIGFIPLFLFFAAGLTVYFIKRNFKKKEEDKNDVIRKDI